MAQLFNCTRSGGGCITQSFSFAWRRCADPAEHGEHRHMIEYHHPGARRILELPVYRCTEEQYSKEQEDKFDGEVKYTQDLYRSHGGVTIPYLRKKDRDNFRTGWLSRNGCLWEFNQIVGWIRLYAWTGNIAAYSFFVRQRITKNMCHKQFSLDRGKYLEMRVFANQSNLMILEELKNRVHTNGQSPRMRRRYIDTGVLDVVGPYIDWLALTTPSY
jgi:hypothetical protein